MAKNKIKKIIALALVVSITIPTINVQALENLNNEVGSTTNELEAISDEVKNQNIENTFETDETNQGENIEGLEVEKGEELESNNEELEAEKNEEELESNNQADDNNSVEDMVENSKEELKEEGDSLEEGIKPEEPSIDNSSKEESAKEESAKEESSEELKGKVYKKKKIGISQALSNSKNLGVSVFSNGISSSSFEEPEEYKMKREELEDLEVLVNMTDANYELAIANADGSYEFVEAHDDLQQAKVASVNLVNSGALNENQQPAVINSSGEIVYTDFVMGRMIIFKNNQPNYSGNVNLYTSSDLKKAFTYTNVGYMEDVPVLEMTDKAAKVMVNGYIGWIENDISSGNYNMKLIPRNQVYNPSYYTVKNGDLVHFISTNMESKTSIGSSLIIGKAPSYLKEGVKYLSYDGNYFYEYNDSNLESKLNSLIGEYRTGSRMGAVNRSEVFYNYYQYLSFRSKTTYTASDLNKYINYIIETRTDIKGIKESKLKDLGAALKDAEQKYGVNALIMLGVAINESYFGTSSYAMDRNNLFGIAAFDSDPDQATTFKTPGDSVLEFAKNYISGGYADPADWRYYGGFVGNKNRGANIKYASDPYWGEKAAQHAYSIDKYLSGGNTNLKDMNANFVGMVTGSSVVIDKSGKELYEISTNLSDYASYNYVPFVINNSQKVIINGKEYYEINPEITNQLYSGNKVNDFDGNYNWNVKGYILASDVITLNVYIPSVKELSGPTRYETAVALSKAQFTSSQTLLLVNGEAIIDGVSAAPLASGLNAPILLTHKDFIKDTVKAEIKRLNPKKVIIIGSEGVISAKVVNELKAMGITNIERLAGKDRYGTSLAVAKYIDKNLYDVTNIVVAAGNGEADALSISPIASEKKMPIILSYYNGPNPEVTAWLKSESLQNAYIIGSEGILSNNALNVINTLTKNNISNNRLGGKDRYETNAKVINHFYGESLNKAYITVGAPLADSLGGGVVAALNKSPIILTAYDLADSQKPVLAKRSAKQIIQIGATVSEKAVNNLKDLLTTKK